MRRRQKFRFCQTVRLSELTRNAVRREFCQKPFSDTFLTLILRGFSYENTKKTPLLSDCQTVRNTLSICQKKQTGGSDKSLHTR